MGIHRVQLRIRSRLVTPLRAETLWGHIAWSIRWHEGEDALGAWLDRYDRGEPPLVLSDPMPSGWLPAPRIPLPPLPEDAPSDEEADRARRARKRMWIARESWEAIAHGVSSESLFHELERSTAPASAVCGALSHAAVNRLTGGTAQEGGGTLFSTNNLFYGADGDTFDTWALSDEPSSDVGAIFERALSGGYGRDAASGAGDIRVIGCEESTLSTVEHANAGVLLGPAVPASADPARGYFGVDVYSGRLGGVFSIEPTPDGVDQKQKNPVTRLVRGSVIIAEPPPLVFGRVVGGVHPWAPVRHCGVTLVLPCRLEDSLVQEAAA
ncbi:MAG: hypothetical protein D6692_14005 [Planctomycetota bacterium]|nr:MAG: hypothetical protein D6692_14005 [Planctomycetota bacterium]